MDLDVVIFGGGAAGLWLLDQLTRRGDRVLLLEAGRLGQGQTVGSQGIIHGGLKYTLQGLLTPAAREIRSMPAIWRDCLTGRRTPDLRQTSVRSETCYLWHGKSLRSRMSMFGARVGLQVAPQDVAQDSRPDVLARCPGSVARLDEQVISPASFLADLAHQHRERILSINAASGLQMACSGPGCVERIELSHPRTGATLSLVPRTVVLTAGAGNGALRAQCQLPVEQMQLRPLHMVLVRGALPALNGHCVDGNHTRVTITSDRDSQGRTVWQVGGQIAEAGVALDPAALIEHAGAELTDVLPGIDLAGAEFATYRIDRAELASSRGKRPDTATFLQDNRVLTAWPTKLALAPQLARMIAEQLPATPAVFRVSGDVSQLSQFPELADWPRPSVALPPWECVARWHPLGQTPRIRSAA